MSHLDDRLRNALHDLNDRVGATAQPRPPLYHQQWTRPSRTFALLVPLLAGVAVLGVLIGALMLFSQDQSDGAPAPAAPAPVDVLDERMPSQTAAEAERDGVYPKLAELPLAERLAGEDFPEESTPEGVWTIRHADAFDEGERFGADGCLAPVDEARSYPFCGEYSEVLLLSPDRSRILRAFPMADRMYWLTVTPDAVYCGHDGDGGLPRSSVCRIDRETLDVVGVQFRCPEGLAECSDDPGAAPRLGKYPGKWSVGGPVAGAASVELGDGGGYLALFVHDSQGKKTAALYPETLEPALF